MNSKKPLGQAISETNDEMKFLFKLADEIYSCGDTMKIVEALDKAWQGGAEWSASRQAEALAKARVEEMELIAELQAERSAERMRNNQLRVVLEQYTGFRFVQGEAVLVRGPVLKGYQLQQSDEHKRGWITRLADNGTDGVEFFDVDAREHYWCKSTQLSPYRGEMGELPAIPITLSPSTLEALPSSPEKGAGG